MKVRFVNDANIVTEVGPETVFEKDDVQDLPIASAERWINRGIAVEFGGAQDPGAPKKKASNKKRASNKKK